MARLVYDPCGKVLYKLPSLFDGEELSRRCDAPVSDNCDRNRVGSSILVARNTFFEEVWQMQQSRPRRPASTPASMRFSDASERVIRTTRNTGRAPITIFIDASLNGKELTTAEVESSKTCTVLRRTVEESVGAPVKLMFGGVVLEDTCTIADHGISDGAHVQAVILKPLLPLSSIFDDCTSISVAEDFDGSALRLELEKIPNGYMRIKGDCGAIQFGPPVPREGVAEWCLHILERCDDGQLNFGLTPWDWNEKGIPHYSRVESQMVGACASWEDSREKGRILLPFQRGSCMWVKAPHGPVVCETPPWLAGCKISLRIENGSFCMTHHSADGTVTSCGYVKIASTISDTDIWDKAQEYTVSDLRLSIYRYFYEREGNGDDIFVLERVE